MRQYAARAADRNGESTRDRCLGTALLLAGIAIVSANGGDIGWLLGGVPIGVAVILLAASRTSSALASCTVVDGRGRCVRDATR
jgi:hypothetical protein